MEDLVISGAKLEKSESEGKHTQPAQHNFHTMSIEKEHSREDFEKYFSSQEAFAGLTEKCLYADLEHLKCRWTAWRAFLGSFEVGDESKIREQVKKDREYYHKELDHYTNFRAKQKLEVEDDNPLSTSTKNPWNNFFGDNELKSEIRKDVERTYQDIDFFYTKECQDMLTNILFVWCKENPDLSYRQGMNEIVGVLTYVSYTESFKAQNPETDLYDFLNDETQTEADIYIAFRKIMSLNQKDMFRSSVPENDDPKAKKKKAQSDQPQRPNLPVVHRAVRIQEAHLPRLNPRLSAHLQKMGVEPQIYMIRWVRCMLSREYRVFQTLIVWDALFSHYFKTNPKPASLEFLDYMCVAMLLYVSSQLLERDDGGMILGRLIKYPPIESVKNMIMLAHEKVSAPLRGEVKVKPQLDKAGKNFSLNEGDEIHSPSSPAFKADAPQQGDPKIILFNASATGQKSKQPFQAFQSASTTSDPRGSAKSNASNDSSGSISSNVNPFTYKKNIDDPFTGTNNKRITHDDPLFGGSGGGQGVNIKKTVQNPFAAAAKVEKVGGDAISSYQHIKAMDKNRQTFVAAAPVIDKTVPEKVQEKVAVVDKKGPVVQKIEEENKKAEEALKNAIDLLKQEIEKNPSSELEAVLNQLNNTISNLSTISKEVQNLK